MLRSHAVNTSRLKPEVLAIAEKAKAEEYSLGKTSEEWEAIEQAERRTVKGKIKYSYKDYFYYPTYRFFRRISEIPDDILAFWQRGRRGWADRDAWGIDSYLSSFLPEMLLHMIDETKGGGNSYPAVKDAETNEKWQTIVREIARGFGARRQIDELPFDKKNPKLYYAAEKRLLAKQKKGLILFQRYFTDLWD